MTDSPRVLNIRNCPGRRIPASAVYLGRAVPRARIAGSKWGNPFKPSQQGDAEATQSLSRVSAVAMRPARSSGGPAGAARTGPLLLVCAAAMPW